MLAVPKVVVPSKKDTKPVGLLPVTVAVKVIAAPKVDGFELDVRAIELATGAASTPCLNVEDVLVALFVSPPYTAVRL